MKKILIILVLLAVAAMPAFASVQNMKVSGSLTSKYVSRTDHDFGSNNVSTDFNQDYFLSITKVKFDADLTDNVAATVELINEREWGEEGTDGSEIDLNLAYVTLREMLYSPLTVMVGRQSFSYGNKLIFAPTSGLDTGLSDTFANDFTKGKGMDSIRAILDYDPLKIEAFYIKHERNTVTYVGAGYDDVDMWGVDATYAFGDDMDSKVEAYFFSKSDNEDESTGTGAKADKIHVPGIIISTNPLDSLKLSVEYAHQFGTYQSGTNTDNRTRTADAVQFVSNYKLPILEDYEPMAKYAFAYFSGDLNAESASKKYRAWDEFYEGVYGNTIFDNLFSLSNLFVHEVALSVKPIEDVKSTLTWYGLWLDDEYDGTASQTQTVASQSLAVNSNKSEVGQEIDWTTEYAYTEDVKLSAELGWFFPGDLFTAAAQDTATQASVSVDVAF